MDVRTLPKLKNASDATLKTVNEIEHKETLFKTGARQKVIFNSANFSALPPTPMVGSRLLTSTPSVCWATPLPRS
jgi:hypothetical protein